MKRAVIVASLLACVSAEAQVLSEKPVPFPDPKKFARGFFASGELGALVFLGKMGRYAGPGPSFGVRVGYDFVRYFGLAAHLFGSISEANTPPPRFGQSFETFYGGLEAIGSLPIRRVRLFAEAGAGGAQLSSNVLSATGATNNLRSSFAILAGGGIDYHTLNRHFSVGLDVDYYWLGSFSSSHALTATAMLRYEH